jgi:hypothetical protein
MLANITTRKTHRRNIYLESNHEAAQSHIMVDKNNKNTQKNTKVKNLLF